MLKVYEHCPVLENEQFLLRLAKEEDAADLLRVYSDKNALPFFNSDNCHGDNFYYATEERMLEALRFWRMSYENGWFVRWAILDKAAGKAVGSIELCRQDADGGRGILRLDVMSSCEREEILLSILRLILPHSFALMDCGKILTKAPLYAVERLKAVEAAGFTKYPRPLTGEDGSTYEGYWEISKK